VFWQSLENTAYLTIVGLPTGLALALLCALALNLRVAGQPVYRAIIYLPSVVPLVVAVFVWKWLLNAEYGYINYALSWFGVTGPSWLGDPAWTKPALILMGYWNIGATAIIFLAALRDVPSELYEAAAVDGAGMLSRFRHVTWPVISPITLFQVIMGIIVNLQTFMQPYMLAASRLNTTGGGPENSLLTYALYLWQNAFSFLRMGYASAMAWLLFLITMVVTAGVLLTSRRWVHYES
jgi:multiple sugar transport system permease protein